MPYCYQVYESIENKKIVMTDFLFGAVGWMFNSRLLYLDLYVLGDDALIS